MNYDRYPFWLKNQAGNASAAASGARNEAIRERKEKEEYQAKLKSVEKVIRELKSLIEKEHGNGNINSELFDLIKEKLEKAEVR